MTTCREIRALMLEADLDALDGQGDTPLAAHLRACPACAAQAQLIQDEILSLDRSLSGEASSRAQGSRPAGLDIDGILERALSTQAPGRPGPASRRRSWPGWMMVAAAAGVAGLLLLPGNAPVTAPARPPPSPPLVEVAPEQNVAVMATTNPDITVLWFYN